MSELKWVKSVFSENKEVNETWQNWAQADLRPNQELAEIVYGPYQEEYQKRALFLLLVPDTRLAPFPWMHLRPFNSLDYEVDFRKVEAGLRAHAIYWLTRFIDYVRHEPTLQAQRPILLDAYNKYILQLLAVLPAEDNQAETLFQYFSINDQTVSKTDMDGLGYKPLLALWKNTQINEKWKRMADSEIRQVIKSELRGDSTPRESWEKALHCYAFHLQSLLPRDPNHLPYSEEFLAEQINFLTSLEVSDQYLIQPESVALVLNLLTNEKYEFIRWRFVRFAVLRDGHFKIYSDQTEESAQMILREKNGDRQIITIVIDALNDYLSKKLAQKQTEEEKKKAKEALLAPMRRPPDIPQEEQQSEQ